MVAENMHVTRTLGSAPAAAAAAAPSSAAASAAAAAAAVLARIIATAAISWAWAVGASVLLSWPLMASSIAVSSASKPMSSMRSASSRTT